MPEIVPGNQVEQKIYLLRGKKIMLSHDLAELYGVTTFNFNKAVKRNPGRFPEDFMFQLTREEFKNLKFHFGTSRGRHAKATSGVHGARRGNAFERSSQQKGLGFHKGGIQA